jgi:hypothetical protein
MSKAKKTKSSPPNVYVPDILLDAIAARLEDPEAETMYPALWACMMPRWDDKTLTRQSARLTIKAEGAHWIISIDMPTEVMTGRVATASLTTALVDFNLAIHEKRIAWSPSWAKTKKKLPTVDEILQ